MGRGVVQVRKEHMGRREMFRLNKNQKGDSEFFFTCATTRKCDKSRASWGRDIEFTLGLVESEFSGDIQKEIFTDVCTNLTVRRSI